MNRLRSALPLLLFLILGLVVTQRAVVGGEAFYFRDLLAYHVPHLALGASLWRFGEVPLWSPRFECGAPHLANPQNLALHPLQILYLLLPSDRAFALSLLLLLFLCGAGMYACARGLGASTAGALAAGTAFELSGFILSLGNLANLLATAAPLPLTFLFAARAVHGAARPGPGPSGPRPAEPARLLPHQAGSAETARFIPRPAASDVAVAALLFALQILGGDPFGAVIALLILAALLPWVAEGTVFRRLARSAAVIAGIAPLAAAIDAAVLIPAAAFIPDTVRSSGFRPEGALLWSLHPLHLVEVILPGIFGDPVEAPSDAFWGAGLFDNGRPFILALGVGKVCLLAAAAALCSAFGAAPSSGPASSRSLAAASSRSVSSTGAIVRGLGWTALGFTILALGRHGLLRLEWLGGLPSLPLVRYPVRLFIAPTFCLCLLAGLGLDALVRGARRAAWARTALALGAALSLAASVTGLLTSGGTVPPSAGHAVVAALARSVLACALLGAALLAPDRRGWGERPRALALIALGAVEPLVSYSGINPSGPRELLTRTPEAARILDRDTERFRIWRDNSPPLEKLPDLGSASLVQTIWFRETLFPSYGLEHSLSYAFNSSGDETDSKRTFILGRRLAGAGLSVRERVLGAAGVKYFLLFREPRRPALESVARVALAGPDLWIWRNLLFLPTARLVGKAYRAGGPETALDRLLSPAHDPRAEVILEEEPPAPDAQGPSADRPPPMSGPEGSPEGRGETGPVAAPTRADERGSGSAEIVEERGSYLRLRVHADGQAYLVLSDRFAPGWEARLDGAPAPIARAEYLFRAVRIPEGEHAVEFLYRPASFRAGCMVSLAGLIGAALALLAPRLGGRGQGVRIP